MTLRHFSLFSGIGGFDLAAEWMGWENVAHCEIADYPRKILKQHWPNAHSHKDIYDLDGKQYAGTIDIISGGFPCQPFSIAGARKGSEDPRHLWPQMLRVIREVRPQFIVAENVPGLLSIESGNTFKDCISTLESEGYETQCLVVPACAFGAIHRRDRLWIVANSLGRRRGEDKVTAEPEVKGRFGGVHTPKSNSNAGRGSPQKNFSNFCKSEQTDNERFSRIPWPTELLVRGADDGLPNESHRVKALGNAIVPQVAYAIFKAIEEANKTCNY